MVAAYVVFASGNARRASAGDPGNRRASRFENGPAVPCARHASFMNLVVAQSAIRARAQGSNS